MWKSISIKTSTRDSDLISGNLRRRISIAWALYNIIRRYEAVITHNCETNWVVKLHETYEDTRERLKLKPFDLCLFHHTQNNSFLSVDGQTNLVTLKELKNQNTQ
jgi:hypothetical protein